MIAVATDSLYIASKVDPLNKGHFGNGPFVLCSEVVLDAENSQQNCLCDLSELQHCSRAAFAF